MYVQGLSATSATSRALNGGVPPWNRLESLVADLWSLWAKKEHPDRAEIVEQVLSEKKAAKVGELHSLYEKRKRTYGLE